MNSAAGAKAPEAGASFEVFLKSAGSYDAAAGVRLIANALDGHSTDAARRGDPLSLPDDLAWPGRVMVVSSALGSRQQSFEYRVFEGSEVILEGRSTKRSFDFRDIEDLLAGVRLQGVEVAPEAVYVDAYPVDDMARLRRELLPFLGNEYMPALIPAPDFEECMLLGELALCVQRLQSL